MLVVLMFFNVGLYALTELRCTFVQNKRETKARFFFIDIGLVNFEKGGRGHPFSFVYIAEK